LKKQGIMKKWWLLASFSLSLLQLSAQVYSIPGFTGYATPAEEREGELFTFSQKAALWKNPNQSLHYYFYLRRPGTLLVTLNIKNKAAGSIIQVTLPGKKTQVSVPRSDKYLPVKAGSTIIKDSGFYEIQLDDIRQGGFTVADIQSIELSGTATIGMHFNTKPRRNAASVHLRYPMPDSTKVAAFYSELNVPAGYDAPHSYYMANGFSRGYFGIQINSPTERRVIFSVWDAGSEPIDRNKVADSNRVQLLAAGKDVVAHGFGNEGTGGHSHWVYPWKNGTTYAFLVTALHDSASNSTIYTGYFFSPDQRQWKLLASFRAPRDTGHLRRLYSFVENFSGENGQLKREALFNNQWIQTTNGSWQELTQAQFSTDATGRAMDRIDQGGGERDGQFYLWNGGFLPTDAKPGNSFQRPALKARPQFNVNNQVDSSWQAEQDKATILSAIADQHLDTTGSVGGVYYHLLEKGSGEPVSVEDTVQVFYKGYFLADGNIFDQTGTNPASFPLKRLIKGWQIGVPLGSVGSKLRIIIPSGLAYGTRARSNKIVPNSILVFDIQVVGTRKQVR
jgi:FKBP-type peptidyl-prolyl cis-trans isomerase